jgi:hypothetical protein
MSENERIAIQNALRAAVLGVDQRTLSAAVEMLESRADGHVDTASLYRANPFVNTTTDWINATVTGGADESP